MKSKKLFLPLVILIAALIVMAAYCVISNIARKPVIAEKEFPFSITYEFNGETVTVEDVYIARFSGHGSYVTTTGRNYDGYIRQLGPDGGASYILSDDPACCVYLHTNFYADYLMGDAHYDYFAYEDFAPTMLYYDADYNEYTDAQSLASKGIRLISWEYPEPIVNSFVFSRIAHMSSNVVLPLVLIALAALIAVLIFVKKDRDPVRTALDKVGILFNILIAVLALPFMTFYSYFSDIAGSSAAFLHQAGYLMPAITLLGLTASVALRRKGFRKSSFAVQFAGPVLFALLFLCLIVTDF